ncbi:MAG: hypothetical protein PHF24_05295 [Syntrophomonas sp.]|nr:hypothetical protein [Syntrophomonas sp.]
MGEKDDGKVLSKKNVLEEAKLAGYNNDSAHFARICLEKNWAGETNIQKAFIAGMKQREKEKKNK